MTTAEIRGVTLSLIERSPSSGILRRWSCHSSLCSSKRVLTRCTMAASFGKVLTRLTGRWGAVTLATLCQGTCRYSLLRSRIPGISEKVLAKTLRDLEHAGLVDRRQHAAVPPHVDYTLTNLGTEIAQRMRGLVDWIDAHIDDLTY